MSSAAVALRAAIHEALSEDPTLLAELGGARVYDEAPRRAKFPYVTLGEARSSDYSAGDERAEEHRIVLHAWSRQGGHSEAHRVAGAVMQSLDDADLRLSGHRLINLRFAVADVRRETDGRTYHAVMRFRAVTEPL